MPTLVEQLRLEEPPPQSKRLAKTWPWLFPIPELVGPVWVPEEAPGPLGVGQVCGVSVNADDNVGALWHISVAAPPAPTAAPLTPELIASCERARSLARSFLIRWAADHGGILLADENEPLGLVIQPLWVTAEHGQAPPLSGTSFGLAFFLAWVSHYRRVGVSADLIASVAFGPWGALAPVRGLPTPKYPKEQGKLMTIAGSALGVRRVLVHASQEALTRALAPSALAGRATPLEVVLIQSLADAVHAAFEPALTPVPPGIPVAPNLSRERDRRSLPTRDTTALVNDTLQRLIDAQGAGVRHVVIGPPGSGKSMLLSAVAQAAGTPGNGARRVLVVHGTGAEVAPDEARSLVDAAVTACQFQRPKVKLTAENAPQYWRELTGEGDARLLLIVHDLHHWTRPALALLPKDGNDAPKLDAIYASGQPRGKDALGLKRVTTQLLRDWHAKRCEELRTWATQLLHKSALSTPDDAAVKDAVGHVARASGDNPFAVTLRAVAVASGVPAEALRNGSLATLPEAVRARAFGLPDYEKVLIRALLLLADARERVSAELFAWMLGLPDARAGLMELLLHDLTPWVLGGPAACALAHPELGRWLQSNELPDAWRDMRGCARKELAERMVVALEDCAARLGGAALAAHERYAVRHWTNHISVAGAGHERALVALLGWATRATDLMLTADALVAASGLPLRPQALEPEAVKALRGLAERLLDAGRASGADVPGWHPDPRRWLGAAAAAWRWWLGQVDPTSAEGQEGALAFAETVRRLSPLSEGDGRRALLEEALCAVERAFEVNRWGTSFDDWVERDELPGPWTAPRAVAFEFFWISNDGMYRTGESEFEIVLHSICAQFWGFLYRRHANDQMRESADRLVAASPELASLTYVVAANADLLVGRVQLQVTHLLQAFLRMFVRYRVHRPQKLDTAFFRRAVSIAVHAAYVLGFESRHTSANTNTGFRPVRYPSGHGDSTPAETNFAGQAELFHVGGALHAAGLIAAEADAWGVVASVSDELAWIAQVRWPIVGQSSHDQWELQGPLLQAFASQLRLMRAEHLVRTGHAEALPLISEVADALGILDAAMAAIDLPTPASPARAKERCEKLIGGRKINAEWLSELCRIGVWHAELLRRVLGHRVHQHPKSPSASLRARQNILHVVQQIERSAELIPPLW